MALNLGGLIADGFIAVEAKDTQQVKNIGRDIINLAKPLGVQQDIINRGKSLTDFAEHGQWDTLKEELEATQNEVKTAMADNKDRGPHFARHARRLDSRHRRHGRLREWALHRRGARMLRQPAIARFLIEHAGQPAGKGARCGRGEAGAPGLARIEPAVSFPSGVTPYAEAVKMLATITERPPERSRPETMISLRHAALALALSATAASAATATDDEVAARRIAVGLAGAFSNDGFKLRDGCWQGRLAPHEARLIQVNLLRRQSVLVFRGHHAEAKKVLLCPCTMRRASRCRPSRSRKSRKRRPALRPRSAGRITSASRRRRASPASFCLVYSYK